MTLTGYVCDPAAPTSGGQLAFVLCVTEAGTTVPDRVRVTLQEAHSRHALTGGMTLEARLRPPTAPLNAGGEGFERWLWRKRIGALATARERHPAPEACGVICSYHAARISLIQRLDEHLQRLRHPGLVEALLLGSRAGLREEDWNRLNRTGTQHLVAISGLHIGLVAGLASLALGASVIRRCHRRPVAGRLTSLFLVCMAAAFYALLAGLTVPTQRALVMVGVAAWVLTRARQWRLWDAWLLAATVVILLEPRSVYGAGFWLSFGAVACLILGMGARFRRAPAVSGLLLAQLAVVSGLAPLLLWHDMAPSGIAFAVNLVAIPWLSIVVMPVLLIAAPFLLAHPLSARWVEPGLDMAVTALWAFLGWAGQWAFTLPVKGLPVALLGAGVGLLLLLPLGGRYRALGASALCLALVGHTDPEPAGPDRLTLRVPDGVGGPVVLVLRDSGHLLFDAREPGARTREHTRDRIGHWLRALGVREVDELVFGHPDLSREQHWNSPALPAIRRVTRASECGRVGQGTGHSISASGIRAGEDICSLRLTEGPARALLTGPLSPRGERRLLRRLEEPERTGLMLAPRGGSGESSQLGFIEALAPALAVVAPPDWYRGEKGAPAVPRYEQAADRVLFTPHTGEVTLTMQAGHWRVRSARDCGPKARLC